MNIKETKKKNKELGKRNKMLKKKQNAKKLGK